jgi:hypothetical protein
MLRRSFLFTSTAAALAPHASSQGRSGWRARWIHPAGVSLDQYGVFLFRRTVPLESKPSKFFVRVTADSRYELLVNGTRVSWGPARGDLNHWRYETVDLAPHLREGKNTLAAIVWNDGPYAALSQWSVETAFLLQAEDQAHDSLVNTGSPGWRCAANAAYQPVPVPQRQEMGYFAIGPCERFDSSKHPWGWESSGFDDSTWQPPIVDQAASDRDDSDAPLRWMLVPRGIPPMEETPIRFARTRLAEGAQPPAGFPAKKASFVVPANTKATILLDQDALTCAFPELEVSGGRGASITMRYSEALWQELKPRKRKGNRGEVEGKSFWGYGDTYVADGAARTYRPLFWRTWRYLQLTIETKAQPLTIEDLRAVYTGYPFERTGSFDTGDPFHQKVIDIGWRTARLCAHETYMDCPYYEQLQYVGDTRIQALVSLYMSGDSRLMRNAIEVIDGSRTAEGATLSRAPSTLQQYIPPFSLWWIGMVHDYWWYVDDPAFVKRMLPGVRAVLGFYTRHLREDGLLGEMPWWNYVDWVRTWPSGRPPSEPGTMPASIHLQLLLALQYASGLEAALGDADLARKCRSSADALASTIKTNFWALDSLLFSEDRLHQQFSQHANSLAVLAGIAGSQADAKELMERVSSNKNIAQCTVYFRYYLDRAMVKAGLGDRYLDRMDTWKFMLSEGLTTWAETDNPFSRSDCHAWGASPNVELLRTVLGVDSAAPGFSKIVIRPHLGSLQQASGVVAHPKGPIKVSVKRAGQGYDIQCTLPPGLQRVEE